MHGRFKSGEVTTRTTCVDPQQSLQIVTQYGSSFWQKSQGLDVQCSDIQNFVNALPQLDTLSLVITLQELQRALKTLHTGKARGMDAVTNWELKHLCGDLQAMLVDLFNLVTTTGCWPSALTRAQN